MSVPPITSLSHPPSSSLLASASDTHLSLYNLPSSITEPTTLKAESSIPFPSLHAVSFPTPTNLYTVTTRGTLAIHSVSDFQLSTVHTLPAAHSEHPLTCIDVDDTIATGGKDGLIRLWSLSGEAIGRLNGHRYEVRSVSLGHGQVLASGGRDKTVRLWDTRSQQCVHTFQGHSSWVHSVSIFNQPFPGIVSCAGDKTVRVWDLRNQSQMHVLKGHQYRVWSVAMWDTHVVSASTDATVRVWDVNTGDVHVLNGHTDSVLCVDASDAYVWSGCEDGTVMMWDIDGVHGRRRNLLDLDDCQHVKGMAEKVVDNTPLVPDVSVKELVVVEEQPTIAVNPIPNGNVIRDTETLKAAISQRPDQAPEYDKSAAELVTALQTIRTLESDMSKLNDNVSLRDRELSALKSSLEQRDARIQELERQLEANETLLEATKVRQLLLDNPRKMDVTLDYQEPANKIGAVSEELCRLKERLEAMVAN